MNIARSFGVVQKFTTYKSKACNGLSGEKFVAAGQVIGNPSIWKILEGQCPNIQNAAPAYMHRDGRKCVVRHNRNLTSRLSNVREALLPIHRAKLVNVLQRNIRNQSAVSINKFKHSLDMFLHTVPDEPQIVGYRAMRRATTNSINQMINFCGLALQVMEDRGWRLELSP